MGGSSGSVHCSGCSGPGDRSALRRCRWARHRSERDLCRDQRSSRRAMVHSPQADTGPVGSGSPCRRGSDGAGGAGSRSRRRRNHRRVPPRSDFGCALHRSSGHSSSSSRGQGRINPPQGRNARGALRCGVLIPGSRHRPGAAAGLSTTAGPHLSSSSQARHSSRSSGPELLDEISARYDDIE